MVKRPGSSSACLSIQGKIQLARSLYTTWKDRLLGTSLILDSLDALRQSIAATEQTMRELGILDLCKHCDQEEGGSCCGSGIENKYDAVLLLINLLFGVSLPEKRYDANSCYFASEHGCVLTARHVLCVNYICSKIEQALHPDKIIAVQRIAGNELDLSFMLHETVKEFMKSGSNDQSLSKRYNRSDHQLL